MKHNYFILPHKDHSVICTLKNKQIVEVSPISFAKNSYFEITEKWVACITQKGRKVSLLKIQENNKFEHYLSILLPTVQNKRYRAHAVSIVNNTLFVGGVCGSEVLGMYDLNSKSPTWIPLEIPEQIKRNNKRIDDLLIDGDRLIAVDNMIFPKWLLLYDISKPDSPQLCSYPEIKAHGSYEHILMGALGSNWFALLSNSFQMFRKLRYIALMKKKELVEILTLSCEQPMIINRSSGKKPRYIQWGRICFLDDTLLITSFTDGIGVLDLTDAPSVEKLVYYFPKSIPGDSVINIIPVPLGKEAIVISTDSEETFFTVVSKNDFL